MKVFGTTGWGSYYRNCGSHQATLIKCAIKSDGPILELGTGFFSTPLLHYIAKDRKRFLISYDDNEDFWSLNKKFQTNNHRIRLVKDWIKDVDYSRHYGLVLIDQSTKNRMKTAIAVKDIADYVVIHDSEAESVYKYDKVWPHYKYRYDTVGVHPMTTVLSNFKDLEWLKNFPL